MRKLIAVVLALVVCVSLPLQIFADEVEEPMEPTEETTETEVIEEDETSMDSETLQAIAPFVIASCEYLQMIAGAAVFMIVVVLCFFAYKFFRIFF